MCLFTGCNKPESVSPKSDSDIDNNIEETHSDLPVDVPADSQLQVHFVDAWQCNF